MANLMPCREGEIFNPLPSLSIIPPPATAPYLFHTPHLIGAAVLVRPDDDDNDDDDDDDHDDDDHDDC